MRPRTILRIEGLTVLVAALAAYLGPLWLLAVLALAPDLSMLGYLAGPRIGSYAYNLVHTYVLSLAPVHGPAAPTACSGTASSTPPGSRTPTSATTSRRPSRSSSPTDPAERPAKSDSR